MNCRRIAVLLGVLCSCLTSLQAEDWGSLSGQIKFKGDVPEMLPLEVGAAAKDVNVCKPADKKANDLIIDPESKGIANICIWVKSKPKSIHPDAANPAKKELLMDQKECRFHPHVMFVQAGKQDVRVVSGDSVSHNFHSFTARNTPVNQIINPNDREGMIVKLRSKESVPMEMKCDIHPWMKAYWMILDHPYGAVTDKDGKFKIDHLPAGEHEFRIWQERVGYIEKKKITIDGDKTLEMDVTIDQLTSE